MSVLTPAVLLGLGCSQGSAEALPAASRCLLWLGKEVDGGRRHLPAAGGASLLPLLACTHPRSSGCALSVPSLSSQAPLRSCLAQPSQRGLLEELLKLWTTRGKPRRGGPALARRPAASPGLTQGVGQCCGAAQNVPGSKPWRLSPPAEQLLPWGPIPVARPRPGKLPLLSAAGPEPAKRFWGGSGGLRWGQSPRLPLGACQLSLFPAAVQRLGSFEAARVPRDVPLGLRGRGLGFGAVAFLRLAGCWGREDEASAPPPPAASTGDSVGCPLPPAQPLLS